MVCIVQIHTQHFWIFFSHLTMNMQLSNSNEPYQMMLVIFGAVAK